MNGFRILLHGTFAANDSQTAAKLPAGFYTSRIIMALDQEAAVVRVKEAVRAELDETLLHDRSAALVSLEPEEIQGIEVDEGTILNRRGFTFYTE